MEPSIVGMFSDHHAASITGSGVASGIDSGVMVGTGSGVEDGVISGVGVGCTGEGGNVSSTMGMTCPQADKANISSAKSKANFFFTKSLRSRCFILICRIMCNRGHYLQLGALSYFSKNSIISL